MARIGRNRREGVAKLSGPPLLVLTSLAEGPKHGHALMKDIEEFSGVRLGAGTLYGAIGRLVERELISPLPEEDRRHPYEITAQGAALLAEAVEEMSRLVTAGRTRLIARPDVGMRGSAA
ncbi:MAG: PadR family transcriptional regulator [Steroidobacteraceae bacterium]